MTLVEILLTLCLLVVLASLTWPALGRPMATQRLRESADQIRMELVRARVEAMSTGDVHVFRYTPDDNSYCVEEYSGDDDAALQLLVSSLDAGQPAEDQAASRSQNRRLAAKVKFVAPQSVSQATSGSAGVPPPVVFHVDGTCTDAQVWLENQYGYRIGLSLRGVTGVVTLSDVQSAEGGR